MFSEIDWFFFVVVVFLSLSLQNRLCVIFVIDVGHGLEVNCVEKLNKRLYHFKSTEDHVTPYNDITLDIPNNECFIDESIALDENDTLIIVPPQNQNVQITTVTFSRPSTLPEFPYIIFQTFPNVSYVRLMFTGIEVLEEDDFINATDLHCLHLEQNYIEHISRTSFAKAITLETLLLPGNRIQKIEDFSFATLKNLIKLDLQQNNLTHLNENIIAGAENLREIFFNDNQIESIADGAFYLEKLQRIYLQDNRLKVLSMDLLTGTPALYGIDLSGNQLRSAQGIFDKCENLTIIGLKRNQIETIDLNEFARIPSLMVLSLESNQLKFDEQHNDDDDDDNDDHNHEMHHKNWQSSKTHLEYLNLDSNNLSASDILQRLSIFHRLKILDLDDNEFTEIDDLKSIRSIFPQFIQLNVNNNSLSCTWLEDVVPVIRKQGIILNTIEIDDDDDNDSDEVDDVTFNQIQVFNIPCQKNESAALTAADIAQPPSMDETTLQPDATGQQSSN